MQMHVINPAFPVRGDRPLPGESMHDTITGEGLCCRSLVTNAVGLKTVRLRGSKIPLLANRKSTVGKDLRELLKISATHTGRCLHSNQEGIGVSTRLAQQSGSDSIGDEHCHRHQQRLLRPTGTIRAPLMSGPPAQKRLKVALPGVPVLDQLAKFHCSFPEPAGVSPGALQGCRVAVKAVQRVASTYASEQPKLALHTAVTLSVAGQRCRHLLCLLCFWPASVLLRAHCWTRSTSARRRR